METSEIIDMRNRISPEGLESIARHQVGLIAEAPACPGFPDRYGQVIPSTEDSYSEVLARLWDNGPDYPGLIEFLEEKLKAGEDIGKLYCSLAHSRWEDCYDRTECHDWFLTRFEYGYTNELREWRIDAHIHHLPVELRKAIDMDSVSLFEMKRDLLDKSLNKDVVLELLLKRAWSILYYLLKTCPEKMLPVISLWHLLLVLSSPIGEVTIGKNVGKTLEHFENRQICF